MMDDLDPVIITGIVNLMLSAIVLFFYVLIAQPPDDSTTPLIVVLATFAGLSIVEFLGWLLHIPDWLQWIRERTDPKQGDKHGSR